MCNKWKLLRTLCTLGVALGFLVIALAGCGLQLAHLITGALFIEIVFSYPGIGQLLCSIILY